MMEAFSSRRDENFIAAIVINNCVRVAVGRTIHDDNFFGSSTLDQRSRGVNITQAVRRHSFADRIHGDYNIDMFKI